MGNDEHSQNVFKKAAEEGLDPLAYCDQMEQEFRRTWRRLDVSFDDFIRTTEPRHKAGVTELVAAHLRGRRHLRGRLRGLVLRRLRGVQAGKGSRRRQVSAASDADARSGSAKRTSSSACRSISSRCSNISPAHPEFLQPDERRNEILRLLEGGLEDISVSRAGQSWGIPLPFDPVERRLRLVRRADQLRVGGRPGHRPTRSSRSGGRPTCTSSARTSRGSTP